MDFTGKTVIVTGAAQGIGREYAHAFAKKGAFIVVADLNEEKVKNTLEECKAFGADGIAVKVNVADEQSARDMVKTVVEATGKIDALVNNASIFSTIKMKPFDEITVEEWDGLMAVNCKGTWIVSKEVAQVMKEQKSGKIVNISSCSMEVGKTDYLHYVASKSSIIGMTRAMARELGPYNINVNTVVPGATFTEVERETNSEAFLQAMFAQMCIGRKQTPEDLVGAVMFFCSPWADFITGQSLIVDGGLRFK